MAHLTMEQRYTIGVLLSENYTQNLIAERIGKHPSVVSRELKRNRDLSNNDYKPDFYPWRVSSLATGTKTKRSFRKLIVKSGRKREIKYRQN